MRVYPHAAEPSVPVPKHWHSHERHPRGGVTAIPLSKLATPRTTTAATKAATNWLSMVTASRNFVKIYLTEGGFVRLLPRRLTVRACRTRKVHARSSASPILPLSKREVLVTPALTLQCGVSVVISRAYLNHRNITPHGRRFSPVITVHAWSTCILIRNATLQLPIL